MCTVVCRWVPGEAVQVLALRDELFSRAFDLPGEWWPDLPGLIGGRDRQGGGSWCVSDVAAGVTAVVLNRPERRVAAPGAPSRGVLPLAAARHGEQWPDFLDLDGMASFNLVLASPANLVWWSFDGKRLIRQALPRGTFMFTPRGLLRSGFDARFGQRCAGLDADPSEPTDRAWAAWLAVVREAVPGPDPDGLLVRRPVGDDSYETVFGQFIGARPGELRLDFLAHPDSVRAWTAKRWTAGPIPASG
jgi:hypothetical protein